MSIAEQFQAKSAALRLAREQGLASLSYEVNFNEEQRIALLEILSKAELPPALEYWVQMLEGLPADEAEVPGCLHGFCL